MTSTNPLKPKVDHPTWYEIDPYVINHEEAGWIVPVRLIDRYLPELIPYMEGQTGLIYGGELFYFLSDIENLINHKPYNLE